MERLPPGTAVGDPLRGRRPRYGDPSRNGGHVADTLDWSVFSGRGFSRIFAGAILHPPGRAWLTLRGVVTLLLGVLIWSEWPASGLWVIGTFVAIDMIFSGTWLIMLALNARSLPFPGTQKHPRVQPNNISRYRKA